MVKAACAAKSVISCITGSVLARCNRRSSFCLHLWIVNDTKFIVECRLPPALGVSGPLDHNDLIHDHSCDRLRWHCPSFLVADCQHLRAPMHLHLRLSHRDRGRCWLRISNLVRSFDARPYLCGNWHLAWNGDWCLRSGRLVLHARAWEVLRLAVPFLYRLPS